MKASGLLQIEKLDNNNYDTWSLQMRSVLIHAGLWKVTSGALVKVEGAAAAAAEWDDMDQKALATITLCVKPSLLLHIKKCKTSSAAWKKLEEIYTASGPVKKISLYRKLVNLRMAEGGDVREHINEFTSTAEKLAEVNIEMSDELLAIILLSSLPSKYEAFVLAMETKDKLPTVQFLTAKVFEEEERTRERADKEISVYAAQSHTNKTTVASQKPKKKTMNNKCFVCGRVGHFARQCSERRNGERETERQSLQQQRSQNAKFQSNALLAATNGNLYESSLWCIDSGATAHMCSDRSCFVNMSASAEKISLPGNNYIYAEGRGDVQLHIHEGDVLLKDVLYVPKMGANFVSVSQAANKGATVKFNSKQVEISDKHNKVILRAHKKNNLYLLEHTGNICFSAMDNQSAKWHARYGHLNYRSMQDLVSRQMVVGMEKINFTKTIVCNICMKCKIHTQPYPQLSCTRAKNLLDLIHTDVCGPFRTKSLGGARYFVTFIDDRSRRVYVYFMNTKDEVYDKFIIFKALVERQLDRRIKSVRSDNGREYVNNRFDELFQSCGIKRQLTTPYSPQQNGVSERMNRTIVEMARTMMAYSDTSEELWAEAIATAVYIRNRSPTKALKEMTPFEAWSGQKPSVKHLRIFGSKAICLDKTQHNKMRPKGLEYIMVGYSLTSKGYRLYDADKKRIIVARDVLFTELVNAREQLQVDDMLSIDSSINVQADGSVQSDDTVYDDAVSNGECEEQGEVEAVCEPEVLSEEESPIRYGPGRPSKIRTGKPGRPKLNRNVLNAIQKVREVQIPLTVSEAVESEHSSEWQESMRSEYESLQKNETWTLVDLPQGQRAIGCKWVFTVKRDNEGNVARFKSRLVAKGCSQQMGVNYTDTYSPVVRYATIRMLLALAAEWRLYVHQMDVCTAYLNSDLNDIVYMRQPQCFEDTRHPEKVLRLNKAIYGLKQSGREWNAKLDRVLQTIGYKPCKNEPCLYKKGKKDNVSFIAVYVDDLLIACKSMKDMVDVKNKISSNFDCTDKGAIQCFLNIRVEREGDLGAISIHQSTYITELLERHKMQVCKPAATPLDAGFVISCTNDCRRVDKTKYQSLIGELTYLAICTRPDILLSVSKLAQRNTDPHSEHEAGVKHILRYLASTVNLKLCYRASGQPIEGYVDADWANNSTDRKSYSGYAFFLGGSAFSWEAKKQQCVALSSTEAEYVALAAATKEALYLRSLLNELCDERNVNQAIIIFGDNLSAQQLAVNPIYHAKSKHIDIKHHFVRDVIKEGIVELKYIPTADMIADILTKNLSKQKHLKFAKGLGLNNN